MVMRSLRNHVRDETVAVEQGVGKHGAGGGQQKPVAMEEGRKEKA